MGNLNFPKYLLCVPAIILVLLIYPIGINTFLFTNEYSSAELDAPGPAMQLNDISSGFSRVNPCRPFPIFHSMVAASVYVPYIWARTSLLPPYDLKTLGRDFPLLSPELIITARLMNIAAALGVPSVVIASGSNIIEDWMPPNNNTRFVYKDIVCRPCERKICPKERYECMEDISVEDVLDKFREISGS